MNIKSARCDIYDVELSPWEVAVAFTRMNSEDQATTLSDMASIMKKWGGGNDMMQLQFITEEKKLTTDARHLMAAFGEYAFQEKKS